MRILVTGGAGYIGSVVVEHLLREGHTVTVLDNLSMGWREAVPSGTEFVHGDTGDEAALDALFAGRSFDAVMHFAALIEAGRVGQGTRPILREQLAAHADVVARDAEAQRDALCVFVDGGGVRRAEDRAHSRGAPAGSDQPVWRIEAAGGADAALAAQRPRPALCQPSVLQCRRSHGGAGRGASSARAT